MSDYATHVATPNGRPPVKDTFWLWAIALVVVLGGLTATVYTQFARWRNPNIAAQIEPEYVDPHTDMPIVTDTAPPPLIETPVETPGWPMPALDESDAEVRSWLTELLGMDNVERYFVPERLVRKFVATIDNLPRVQVVPQQRPVQPTPEPFITAGPEEELVIAVANYARYAPLVTLLQNTPAQTVVALYRRYRPLFQEAYEDLGYPNRSFDDRLLNVIDHLIATPDVRDPIRLVQPRVMYEFADPELEEQSAGRKLLLRMGSSNAATVKAKLREIRTELTD